MKSVRVIYRIEEFTSDGEITCRTERKKIMSDNYYEKVAEYAEWFYVNEDGAKWDIDEIAHELKRCRDDNERYLNTMSDEVFSGFVHDVIEVYINLWNI